MIHCFQIPHSMQENAWMPHMYHSYSYLWPFTHAYCLSWNEFAVPLWLPKYYVSVNLNYNNHLFHSESLKSFTCLQKAEFLKAQTKYAKQFCKLYNTMKIIIIILDYTWVHIRGPYIFKVLVVMPNSYYNSKGNIQPNSGPDKSIVIIKQNMC